jgi:hypothetical protein
MGRRMHSMRNDSDATTSAFEQHDVKVPWAVNAACERHLDVGRATGAGDDYNIAGRARPLAKPREGGLYRGNDAIGP